MLNREVVTYIIFGVLTTVINIIVYAILAKLLHVDYKIATTIAWIASVLFAFVTNKMYVFNSRHTSSIVKEMFSFIFLRLFSYGLDLFLMFILIEFVIVDDLVAKVLTNIVVIIVNYVGSKYVVFKQPKF